MASTTRDMLIKLKADNREMKRKFAESERKVKSFSQTVAGIKVAYLAAAAGAAVFVRGIKSTLDAFARQEKAERGLRAALEQTGNFTQRNVRILKDYASALQSVTLSGDEAIIEAQTLLVTLGTQAEHLKEATELTLDWAVAMGKDLNSAALDVGKAMGGNIMMLQRYGIEIDKTAFKTQGASVVLEKLRDAVGGRARAEADTVTSAFGQLNNVLGDVSETIGEELAPPLAAAARDFKTFAEALIIIKGLTKDWASDLEGGFKAMQQSLEIVGWMITPWNKINELVFDYAAKIVETNETTRSANEELDKGKDKINEQAQGMGAVAAWTAEYAQALGASLVTWERTELPVRLLKRDSFEISRAIFRTKQLQVEQAKILIKQQLVPIREIKGAYGEILSNIHMLNIELGEGEKRWLNILKTVIDIAEMMKLMELGKLGGVGGFFGIAGSVLGGILPFLHKGGVIPKAHGGMLAGDEVPIIAQRGEMILNQRQQAQVFKALDTGTGGGEVHINLIINDHKFAEVAVIPGLQKVMRSRGVETIIDVMQNQRHGVRIS